MDSTRAKEESEEKIQDLRDKFARLEKRLQEKEAELRKYKTDHDDL